MRYFGKLVIWIDKEEEEESLDRIGIRIIEFCREIIVYYVIFRDRIKLL